MSGNDLQLVDFLWHGCQVSNLHHIHEAGAVSASQQLVSPQQAFQIELSVRNLHWNTWGYGMFRCRWEWSGTFFQRQTRVCCVPLGSAICFPVEGRDLHSDPAMATAADLHNQIATAKKTLEEKLDGMRPFFRKLFLGLKAGLTRKCLWIKKNLDFTSNSWQMDIHSSSSCPPNMEKRWVLPYPHISVVH